MRSILLLIPLVSVVLIVYSITWEHKSVNNSTVLNKPAFKTKADWLRELRDGWPIYSEAEEEYRSQAYGNCSICLTRTIPRYFYITKDTMFHCSPRPPMPNVVLLAEVCFDFKCGELKEFPFEVTTTQGCKNIDSAMEKLWALIEHDPMDNYYPPENLIAE